MNRVARRYAKALFALSGKDLAEAKKQRDSLYSLKALFEIAGSGRVLRSPVMPVDLKKSLLDYGLKQTDASEAVKKTVDTVLESGRVELLPDVADAFSDFIDEAEGVARAQIESAVPLQESDLKAISAKLGTVLNKNVDVTGVVDPSLLGGFVARVGNYRIDMSLKSKLEGLASNAVQDSIR